MSSKSVNDHLRNTLHRELVASGKKDQLVEMLRARLVESGWRDDLKEYTRSIILASDSTLTVDELVEEINPHARATVPDRIKTDLLAQISAYVEEEL